MEMCVLLFLVNFGNTKSIIFEAGEYHTTLLRSALNNMVKYENFGGLDGNQSFSEEEIDEKINTFFKNI